MVLRSFVLAFIFSLAIVPLVRILGIKTGIVSAPRKDRWHTKPTPYMGGIAIFFGVALSMALTKRWDAVSWGLMAGGGIAFVLGLIDDVFHISPQSKLLGLFLSAALIIFSGTVVAFTPGQIVNMAISLLWIVGITNALNLLDNMDGLASGITLVMACFLCVIYASIGDIDSLIFVAAIGGSVLGFFIFNFPPASIFMGDSGSLFLGITLSSIAITHKPQASNLGAIIGVPVLIFLLPILDTAMVSITQIMRGQSPAQGGRDHTSHRMVALGLSGRQTLFVMMVGAIISGLAAILLERFSYSLSFILIPILILVFALITAYLGQLKVVEISPDQRKIIPVLTNWLVDLTYRRRILEIVLDFFLIALAYYFSYVLRFSLPVPEDRVVDFLFKTPIILISTFGAFLLFGVYRGVWRYLSLNDMFLYIAAISIGSTISYGLFAFFNRISPEDVPLLILFVLTFGFLITATRNFFRFMDEARLTIPDLNNDRILIYGAGDAGEVVLRECRRNEGLNFDPIGFIDDDAMKAGRNIRGVKILGTSEDLRSLVQSFDINGVIITSNHIGVDQSLIQECKTLGVWIKKLRLEFEEVSIDNWSV